MRLSMPAHRRSLAALRGAVTEALERSRWPEERVGDVLLAVSEAVANAIEHGSRPGEAVEMDIMVTPDDADGFEWPTTAARGPARPTATRCRRPRTARAGAGA